MTNNTKPIIDDTHFACPEALQEHGGDVVCCECSGHACIQPVKRVSQQKRLTGKKESRTWQEQTIGDILYNFGFELGASDKIFLEHRDAILNIIRENYVLEEEIATAVQEERKRIAERLDKYKCDFNWDFEKNKERHKSYVALVDVLKAITDKE